MYMFQRTNIPASLLYKRAVALLTPEAMQAAMTPPPPPQDPNMMAQGGMPMDPAAMGGMPPQGAPMDPAAMGGMPMDPSMMQGGMPPQGAAPAPAMGGLPPEIMQDQMFMEFLAQAFGIMFDPGSGAFFDQNGQPVPPEMLMQAYQTYMQAMQQMQGGGMPPAAGGAPAPMDPAMAGGVPMGAAPMDPAAMGGQPMPPEAGGAEEQPMDPMMQELASLMASVMEDSVVTPFKEAITSLEKQIADMKEMIKTIRDENNIIKDQLESDDDESDERSAADMDAEDRLNRELAAELQPTLPKAAASQQNVAASRPLNILDILGRK